MEALNVHFSQDRLVLYRRFSYWHWPCNCRARSSRLVAVLSSDEFKAARKSFGLNQEQMAQMLGYGSKVRVSEIENGREPGAAVARLMQAYVDGYRPEDWPAC